MYVNEDFATKKALKEAIAQGRTVRLIAVGPFDQPNKTGTVTIEGPHYPKPHRWWATATVENGRVVAVK